MAVGRNDDDDDDDSDGRRPKDNTPEALSMPNAATIQHACIINWNARGGAVDEPRGKNKKQEVAQLTQHEKNKKNTAQRAADILAGENLWYGRHRFRSLLKGA